MRASLTCLLALGGCMFPSNVVAPDQREVHGVEVAVAFGPASAADLDGLFVAASIRGPAAATLRHLTYWLEPAGRFSGAALLARAGGSEFETLSGRWSLENGRLALGDNEPAKVEAAPGWLRLSGDDGTVVVLRRTAER